MKASEDWGHINEDRQLVCVDNRALLDWPLNITHYVIPVFYS